MKSTDPTGLKLRVGGCSVGQTVPFWLAPPRSTLKIDYRSAYNDPLRGFEASWSGCNAGANWQSLSRPAMNYEPIIHGCRAEFTRVYRSPELFLRGRHPGEKSLVPEGVRSIIEFGGMWNFVLIYFRRLVFLRCNVYVCVYVCERERQWECVCMCQCLLGMWMYVCVCVYMVLKEGE